MKNKIAYSLIWAVAALCVACENELPKANFELYEVDSFTATAGDMSVALSWVPLEAARPVEYLITWTSGTAETGGGEMAVEATATSATVSNLVNDVAYTFAVQPRYDSGLASKTIASCTPKNARYPITQLMVAAGSQKVRLSWTKPASERLTSYKITVLPENRIIDLTDTSLTEYIVTDLTNDQSYTFAVTCLYPTGVSDAVEVTATPGQVSPILVGNTEAVVFESCLFNSNDMYFMGGTISTVAWDFGDGSTSADRSPIHSFALAGTYIVTATVTYANHTTESGTIEMTVVGYKWSSVNLNFNGLSGYVKVSNPVFSPDSKTLYIPTSTPGGNLFAIDVSSGEFKWVFAIPKITYGGGALVSPDGTIYQCVEDATINNVYAIRPDGSEKWSLKLDNKIGASPALSADGTLYCLTNKSTLYAIHAATGAIKWQQTLDGATGSAVAIDKNGAIYAGTSSGIYAFGKDHAPLWKIENINVTERGAFAMVDGTLYATLKASGGLVAVNTSDGSVKWSYGTSNGDSYLPIVDKTGVVFFTQKTSQTVYAVNPAGTLKWKKSVGNNLNYSGLVLSADGVLYCGTQSGNKIFGLDSSDGAIIYEEEVGQQVMASAVIGPDRRLYVGTIGSGNIGSIKAFPIGQSAEAHSWSVRGGDVYGTNCQQ